MKKIITSIAALALAGAIAIAQEKPAASAQTTTAAGDPIIVAAGDLTIRQSEFESALKTLPAEYQQYAMGPGKKQFAEDFLRMKMLAAEGLKNGLDKDPNVLRQLELMRTNLIANAQLERIESSVKVSDEDLKKTYEASKNEYEQVSARHILIAFKGSPAADPAKPERTEDEAKAKAEEIRAKIVGGASFDELAKTESDDAGSGARGGDLGSFGRGQMVPEFEAAAFAAKAGEVTPVVRTQFGYHVIRVDNHEHTPFEQVRTALEQKERQAKVQAALDQMKANANITFNDAYFGAMTEPQAAPQQ